MTLVMSAMILATGLICAAVPSISSPTVPLGVSVPRVRTSEPVVTRAIRSYRLACVALTLACIVGAWLTRALPASGSLWLLGLILAAMAAFEVCRAPIVRTKREQDWYGAGACSAPNASGTPAGEAKPEPPDDDHLWKLGLVYYNRADRRAFVPKRNGVGYEPNAGHPLGLGIYLLAPIAISVAFAVVLIPG